MPDRMMTKVEVERIRRINGKKAHGHIDSAVSHCAFLLSYIDVLEQQNSHGEARSRIDALAMFVRRMLSVMSHNGLGEREVCKQARKYLTAIGVTGSILREDDIREAEVAPRA